MCEPSRPACLDRGGQKGETDMELGSWSIIQAPSLLALIPLVVMIVLIFRGKSNVSAIMVGVLVGALLLGQDLGAMAKAFATSLGSSTALIGLIIMMGAGLGVLMSEAGVTHTLVYWIVKRIGVNTQTKGKIALVVVSIIVCGLLGTLGGGFDALSNLLTYGSNGNQVTAKDQAAAKASYAALQQEIMADYADMKAAVAAADTLEAKQTAATNASNAMSQKVYNTTLKMYNKLQAKTAARAWVSSLLH